MNSPEGCSSAQLTWWYLGKKDLLFPSSELQRQPMNYLLPLLSHPPALLCTDAALAPKGRADESWPLARGRAAAEVPEGSGAGQAAAAHTGTHTQLSWSDTTGDQGLCRGRMAKWSWGRCSMARAEILGNLQNCGQNKIHWVVLIPSFLQHLCFSGMVFQNCLCQAESIDMR